jgi:thiol-disulfide isomerase/thioredoxin
MSFYKGTSIKTLGLSDFVGKKLLTGKWTLVEIYSPNCTACRDFKHEYTTLSVFIDGLQKCTNSRCAKARKVMIAAVNINPIKIAKKTNRTGEEQDQLNLVENMDSHIDTGNYIPELFLYNNKGKVVDKYEGNRKAEDIVDWILNRDIR